MTTFEWLKRVEQVRPFAEPEAWNLFRFIAIAEAFGWTILIIGIGIQDYILPGSNFAIPIAGQIHGMIFIAYFGVLLATYTSLSWSRPKFLLAAAAGVPPYGSLAFELWAARARRRDLIRRTYRRIIVAGLIIHDHKLLIIQPANQAVWLPPGGVISEGETPPAALSRIIADLTGVKPRVGNLRLLRRMEDKATETMEMYFLVTNPSDFVHATPAAATVEEIKFGEPSKTQYLEPAFLHTRPLSELADAQAPVEFL